MELNPNQKLAAEIMCLETQGKHGLEREQVFETLVNGMLLLMCFKNWDYEVDVPDIAGEMETILDHMKRWSMNQEAYMLIEEWGKNA